MKLIFATNCLELISGWSCDRTRGYLKWTLRLKEEFTTWKRKDILSRDCTKMPKMLRCGCRDVRSLLNDRINTGKTKPQGRPLRRRPGPSAPGGSQQTRVSDLSPPGCQLWHPLAGICGTDSTTLPGKRGILSPPFTTAGPPTPTTPSSEALLGPFLTESHVHELLCCGFAHWGGGAAQREGITFGV